MKWLTVIAFFKKTFYCSHCLLELSADSLSGCFLVSSNKNSESVFKAKAAFRVHGENKALLSKVVMQKMYLKKKKPIDFKRRAI